MKPAQSICASGATLNNYNEQLVQQGRPSQKTKERRGAVERNAHRGRQRKIFGSEQFLRGTWRAFHSQKKHGQGRYSADAAQDKQEGIQGQWQHESPLKKSFGGNQKKCGYRLQCPNDVPCAQCKEVGQLRKFTKECRKEGKPCEWTIERLQEADDKVALEDFGRLSIAQDILRQGHGLLETDHRSSWRNRKSYPVVHLPTSQLASLWMTAYGGYRTGHGDGKKKHCNWWSAACGGQYGWRAPNRIKNQSAQSTVGLA